MSLQTSSPARSSCPGKSHGFQQVIIKMCVSNASGFLFWVLIMARSIYRIFRLHALTFFFNKTYPLYLLLLYKYSRTISLSNMVCLAA